MRYTDNKSVFTLTTNDDGERGFLVRSMGVDKFQSIEQLGELGIRVVSLALQAAFSSGSRAKSEEIRKALGL